MPLFVVKENLEEKPHSPTDKALEILKEVNKLKPGTAGTGT